MNVKFLKSKMVLYGDEDFVTTIAKLLEISRQTASAKLSGKSDFTRSEIVIISKHYDLSAEEIQQIFIVDENNESIYRVSEATQHEYFKKGELNNCE